MEEIVKAQIDGVLAQHRGSQATRYDAAVQIRWKDDRTQVQRVWKQWVQQLSGLPLGFKNLKQFKQFDTEIATECAVVYDVMNFQVRENYELDGQTVSREEQLSVISPLSVEGVPEELADEARNLPITRQWVQRYSVVFQEGPRTDCDEANAQHVYEQICGILRHNKLQDASRVRVTVQASTDILS